jgi:hypothetical protein
MGCARASCASSSDPLRLFELSERSERCELRNAAHGVSTAGCPQRSCGTGAPGSPSFASFSWRDKKSKSGCGDEVPTSSSRSTSGVGSSHRVRARTRGRDVRPAAQSLSLVSPRESDQREGDPGAPDPALRAGQAAVLAAWAHRATRCVHFVHCAQTSTMGQSWMRKMLLRRPGHCAPRRGHRGPRSRRRFGPSLRSAAPSPLRLFELSERSERCELRNAAHGVSTAGCPQRSCGTGAPGSPSFACFSWRDKKSKSGRGDEVPTSSSRSASGVGRSHCVRTRTRGPDVLPAAQSLSFVSPKESNQRKGDPGAPDPALRAGQAAVLAAWAHRATRCVHCVHFAQTSTMGQSWMRKMLLRCPGHCAPRRGHRGPRSGRPLGPSLRSALPLLFRNH